jgi:4-hydroxy 2-oxovalerate aldolase
MDTFQIVKDNGYKLFIQGVESLNYTDREMLETIDVINEIKPHSFGIVDTYGAMYKDDVLRLFQLIDHNLDEDIAIDFHSHNNMQLSFSFAQEVVEASKGKREIVLDATLEGLGKGTGNLNTELIMDYLMRKHNYIYNIDAVFDTIDEYINWIKEEHSWTYSIPSFMAGIYSSHANNISYLMEKHRMHTKDIKHILSMIEPVQRKRYNYDNIEKLYVDYFSKECDDKDVMAAIKEKLHGKPVLVLVPGKSLSSQAGAIKELIDREKPVVISVNRVYGTGEDEYAFFGNQRRYDRAEDELRRDHTILTSNITKNGEEMVVNYNQLLDRSLKHFDNSTVMLLKLLQKLGINQFMVAGLDGFDEENSYQDGYDSKYAHTDYKQLNADIDSFLKEYSKCLPNKEKVQIITGGRFAYIFEGKQ